MNGGATYSFLSWTRRGLANAVTGAPQGASLRASLEIKVEVEGDQGSAETISRDVELVGPGDIVGISPQAIIRQEPGHWVKDFLPNYLAFIEFYDEDFPWRHSPEPPDEAKDQLRPWLALVVLAEEEFEEAPATGPLGSIKVTAAATKFPSWTQLWAWAHVQVNADIAADAAGTPLPRAQVAAQFEALVTASPDIACSRLICPRRLEPKKAYHAFLIPAYESGRLAGLGRAMEAGVIALSPAWGGPQEQELFPYYHRWEFGTASRGDFEYLVGLLKPRAVDPRVGTRAMDVRDPGGGVPKPSLDILALEGALRSPQTMATAWPASYPEAFQQKLALFINKADGVQLADKKSDPVITPPLYGRWHALRPQLSTVSAGGAYPYDPDAKWITELNLDPRHRAVAGLGASVICERQEELMNEAWWQVGDILEANRQIRISQLAAAASNALYIKNFAADASESALAMTQPIHGQVLGSTETIRFKVRASPLPEAALSPSFRRLVRPRGKVARAAFPAAGMAPQQELLARINRREISHAPPKAAPAGAATLANLGREVEAAIGVPAGVRGLARLALLAARTGLQVALAGLKAAVAVLRSPPARLVRAIADTKGAIAALNLRLNPPGAREMLAEARFTAAAVAAMPSNAAFRITAPEQAGSFQPGGADSIEAVRFKDALSGLAQQFTVTSEVEPSPAPLDFDRIYGSIRIGIDPWRTIPGRTLSSYSLPSIYREQLAETFAPVLAYPKFGRPMYEALRDVSVDHLIPNMNLVPPNTIALLKENRRFIEAYMVGLNHEMARELLWREYPGDSRGSYFRQFWDVRDSLAPANVTKAAWAEQTKDIPEIHTWSLRAALGAHPNRAVDPAQDSAVLLIRGAVLQRFPNVVIYAHRAAWQLTNGNIDKAKPRALIASATEAQRADNEKYPVYSATVAPDVSFIGFDLGITQAKGVDPDPGWFFVLKQRPGETLFGLDIEDGAASTPLLQWDDLTWEDLELRSGVKDKHIILPSDPPASSTGVAPSDLKIRGVTVVWNDASNAAAIAAILYQDPVMVAVHAKEMLPK